MCGIIGAVKKGGVAISDLINMRDAVDYRGPDGKGVKTSSFNGYGVGLAHRRLAIIDLSANASQPMMDDSGKVGITYNGEVYNFRELRDKLVRDNYIFHSSSDTEVVLKSYLKYGVKCLDRFNGMFAFGIWDETKGRLILARDRYGIKPLYYYEGEGEFYFASEIKSLLKVIKAGIDLDALDEYLTFQNIFTDRTLFKGVKLLPPGHFMIIDINGQLHSELHKYWQYHFTDTGFKMHEVETADHVKNLFVKAVVRQSVSDVPLATYISGGMDTGSITAVLSRVGKFKTFTCGFDLSSVSGLELAFDERPAAEEVSNLFKTEHYEVVLHAGDMESCFPDLIWHLEDLRVGQCYPNYYAAYLASRFVKVIMSGTGGDEFFGGYPWRYYRAVNNLGRLDYLKKYYNYWQRLVSDSERPALYCEGILSQIGGQPYEVFQQVFDDLGVYPESDEECINASMQFEARTFLHGLFVVEDKLSMAYGLETRVPFLDNDLVDFAMTIPPWMKLKNLSQNIKVDENDPMKLRRSMLATNDGKNILRQAMRSLLPESVLAREKRGFSGPDASWFRGDSIDYVNKMLRGKEARIYNYLSYEYINQRLDDHMEGKVNDRLFIWSLLSLELWFKIFQS